MKRAIVFSVLVLSLGTVFAQRPANAPATAPSGKPPDSVFLEDLTWAEVRDLTRAGWTTAIVGTAGTEQKGPHMVDGEHKFVMEYAADKVARAIGKTLVAPVVTYVPEGNWTNPGGHMGKPGTITLPDDRFVELLVSIGRSLKSGGFTTILFLGESGGNQNGQRNAAAQLTELWKGDARAFTVPDYYTKGHADQRAYITNTLGIPASEIGGHANIQDTSELLFVNPKHVRPRKMAPGGGYPNSGVSGDPTKATAELGKIFLQIKIDNAVAQIKTLTAGPAVPAGPSGPTGPAGPAGTTGGGRGRGGNAGQTGQAAGAVPAPPPAQRPPTMETAPAGISPTDPPDTVFIDELTWEETRDLMKAGRTTVIIPTGGTEKNGYHMALGKHNMIVTHAANLMARRIKNTLVAPTIQFVPEGNPDRQNAGAISLPSPAYDRLLDAAARSLKAHGFREIIFIGNSGGNQDGMTAVAKVLNEEWKGQGVQVFALTDYYGQGRVDYRAWMLKEFGYDDATIGSHAGISDTSSLLHVKPSAVRMDQIKPGGGAADSGVSGDPTKATAEIGRRGIEFKIEAALRQMAALKKGSSQPPNIVFILVDDMRWDDFGAGGHPFIETPNMDRLAREGIRFLNAFATTPLCSPSRASLLTGQYAHTNGIIDNTARPSHNLSVFPIDLQRAGYTTGFFGKWHMGNDASPRPGFNRWVALPGQGEAVDPHVNIDGQPQQLKGYVTDVLTDHVDEFIRNAGAAGKPFLAYLAHKAIHPNVTQRDDGSLVTLGDQPGGFVAADRHRGRYRGRAMPRRPNAFKPPVDKPALMRTIGTLPPLGRETATTDEEIRGRLEMLLAVDDSLGRIIETLEKASALDNTVIVFTSDHGYFYGEHGLNEERRLAYEETIRIPLLMRYPPRIKAGSTSSNLVLTIDLAPTVLALAGVTPPATIEGRSLVPVLTDNPPRDWRTSFLVEYYSDTVFPRMLTMGYTAVRTDRYKYIEYRELQGMNELYDLQADPYEERNLISAPASAAIVEAMRKELAGLRR